MCPDTDTCAKHPKDCPCQRPAMKKCPVGDWVCVVHSASFQLSTRQLALGHACLGTHCAHFMSLVVIAPYIPLPAWAKSAVKNGSLTPTQLLRPHRNTQYVCLEPGRKCSSLKL